MLEHAALLKFLHDQSESNHGEDHGLFVTGIFLLDWEFQPTLLPSFGIPDFCMVLVLFIFVKLMLTAPASPVVDRGIKLLLGLLLYVNMDLDCISTRGYDPASLPKPLKPLWMELGGKGSSTLRSGPKGNGSGPALFACPKVGFCCFGWRV